MNFNVTRGPFTNAVIIAAEDQNTYDVFEENLAESLMLPVRFFPEDLKMSVRDVPKDWLLLSNDDIHAKISESIKQVSQAGDDVSPRSKHGGS